MITKKSTVILFLLIILYCTKLNAQNPFITDAQRALQTKEAIATETSSFTIKTKEKASKIASLESLRKISEQTQKQYKNYQKISSFFKGMSQYKRVTEEILFLSENIEISRRKIKNPSITKFSNAEGRALGRVYNLISNDLISLTEQTVHIFTKGKFNMLDGARLKILEEQEKKLRKINKTLYCLNLIIGSETARRTNLIRSIDKALDKEQENF